MLNERRLIAFDHRGVSIVYRRHTGHSVSVSGAIENTFADSTIVALVGPALTDGVEGSPADRYIADGTEYAIAEIAISRDQLVYDLIGRELDS